MFSARVKKFGYFETINKQIRFATAVALTKTAKQAQTAVLGALRENFTLRTNWAEPSSKIGIRIKPAKKDDLEAQVKTAANFLKLQDEGGEKLPKGKMLAIPTVNVKRNKRDLIAKANRPNALRGKRTFIIQTPRGPVLFQRKFKGKRSQIVALYNLEPKARISARPVFKRPVESTAMENFNKNFEEACKQAFATAR